MTELRDALEMMHSYMTPEQIEESKELAAKDILAIKLSKLREKAGVPQEKMKDFSQTAVSKLEKRKDIKLSTLINYTRNLGMNLKITASDANHHTYVLLNTSKL